MEPKDPEEMREAARLRSQQARANHPEKIRQRKAAYYASHLEQVRAAGRRYYWKNREKVLAQKALEYAQRQKKARTPPRDAAHARQRAMKRSRQQRRNARQRGLPDTFTKDQEAFMWEYWNYACAVCGNTEGFFFTLAMDHWIPLSDPSCPGHVAQNIVPLCHGLGGCNTRKYNLAPDVWLRKQFGARRTKRILQAVETYFALV